MKKLIFLCSFVFCVGLMSAIEFGGIINSSTDFMMNEQNGTTWLEQADAMFSAKIPFTPDGGTYLATEVVYRLYVAENDISHGINIPLLKLYHSSYVSNALVEVAAGRFFVSDITNKVFFQTADGFSGKYSSGNFGLSVFAGYTGFVNSLFTSMTSLEEFELVKTGIYDLSLPFVVCSASVTAPQLLKQTISADVWGMIGIQGLQVNKIYATASVSGPIYKGLYYTLQGTGSFISKNKEPFEFGYLAESTLAWYFNKIKAVAGLKGEIASDSFESVTLTTTAADMPWNNVVNLGGYVSLVPVSSLYCQVLGEAVFAASDFAYLGTLMKGNLRWQVVSDVALAVEGSHFLAKEKAGAYTYVSVNAIVSF